MYRPPLDIMFRGGLPEVREQQQIGQVWQGGWLVCVWMSGGGCTLSTTRHHFPRRTARGERAVGGWPVNICVCVYIYVYVCICVLVALMSTFGCGGGS